MEVIKFYFTLNPLNKFLDSLHGTLALIPVVRTTQFDTILNEPLIIITQMKVNTCWPESMPRVIPHLETRITDTSSVQNNMESSSPGICSNIYPGSSICTYRLQSDMSPQNHKEQFYTLNITSSI